MSRDVVLLPPGAFAKTRNRTYVEKTGALPPIEKVVIHANTGIEWQRIYLDCWRKGMSAVGMLHQHTATNFVDPDPSVVHVIFANNFWKKVEALCPKNRLITVNRCFFGDPIESVSIGWGGFNGEARYPLPGSCPFPKRRPKILKQPLPEPKPLPNFEDLRILVLGEYATPANCEGHFLRPHPKGTPNPLNLPVKTDYSGISAVMTYGGTTAIVDAVIQGFPVFNISEKNTVKWLVGEEPCYTDRARREWFLRLAMAQWRQDEIAKGWFWEALCSNR